MLINSNQRIWLNAFFAFILIIQPKLFTQYTGTVIFYAVGNLLLFLIYFIKVCRNLKCPRILFFWVILRLYLLLIMMANGNLSDLDQWGYLSLMVANIILVIQWFCKKGYIKQLLSAIIWVGLIFLSINALSLVFLEHGFIKSSGLYDNGDNDYYFLGIKVAYTTYIVPSLSAAGIYSYLYKRKNLLISIAIISLFNIFYANISTGKVCMIVFLVLLGIVLISKGKISLSIRNIILVVITLNVAIILFDAHMMFSYFITNVLHKSLTLTGRTEIWRNAVNFLNDNGLIKLLIGNGIENEGAFVPYGGSRWPAHNQWLQNIFEYGLIGTIGIISFINHMDNGRFKKGFSRNYLLCICCAVLVGTITMHYFGYAHMFIPFILLYYVEYFQPFDKMRDCERNEGKS